MEKKRILIIDDEPSFTRMVKLNLEQTGNYEVREENRAVFAVKAARDFKPSLILLDVVMPTMDGGDVASAILADPMLKGTPIVFLTATVAKRESGSAGLNSGGFLFIAKPVGVDELIKAIEQHAKVE